MARLTYSLIATGLAACSALRLGPGMTRTPGAVRPVVDVRMQAPKVFNLAPDAAPTMPTTAATEAFTVAPPPWENSDRQLLQLKREDPYLQQLIKKCPQLSPVWRRADFWVNETATFLEIVNVLGRFDTCDQWAMRTKFVSCREHRTHAGDAPGVALTPHPSERTRSWRSRTRAPRTGAIA